jgi:pentatricopeptide repeat protein
MLDEGDAFKIPTLTTFNYLIREARRAGDHAKALGVLDRLQEINADTIFRR